MSGPESLTPTAFTVYKMLERAADAGEPCPSNYDICAKIEALSPSRGSILVDQIEKAGLIEVERGACRRVVTIVATGNRTQGVAGTPHWRNRPDVAEIGEKISRTKRLDLTGGRDSKASRPRVYRDPCPRCGVRGDIGCSHHATRLVVREGALAV